MAFSTGIDRWTGAPLSDWLHVLQCLHVIFSTRPGSRVMRRVFGSVIPGLLGKNMTPATVLKFYTAIVIAIEMWEPRFKVRKISYPGQTNSEQLLRQGRFGFRLDGDYRPRALDEDFTVERPEVVFI